LSQREMTYTATDFRLVKSTQLLFPAKRHSPPLTQPPNTVATIAFIGGGRERKKRIDFSVEDNPRSGKNSNRITGKAWMGTSVSERGSGAQTSEKTH